MKAMVLDGVHDLRRTEEPLRVEELPDPEPGPGEVLLRVTVCGVCHTELDEIEGRTPPPRYPVIPGHQAVGRVIGRGEGATALAEGDRVGVAWIWSACGECVHCRGGEENLCADFRATGRDADGGYAQLMTAPEGSAYPVPEELSDSAAAPLLCAGAIGYRSLRLTGLVNGRPLGLTGFGGSGHLVLKMARFQYPESAVCVFARNPDEREFARELGATWAGDTTDEPPEKLAAIIDTTPVWKPVVAALEALAPGGRLVINAIRKEGHDVDLLAGIDYERHLWMEKEVKSVANVARRDVTEFLALAAEMGIRPEVAEFPLAGANRALMDLKRSRIRGAKVLRIG